MEKQNALMIVSISLIILGIIMIYLGVSAGPEIVFPPVLTGIGFFVMAWAFIKLRKQY